MTEFEAKKVYLKDEDGNYVVPVAYSARYSASGTDLDGFANTDLSNLSATGEAKFADIDLSNLSATGNAKFADIDLSNLSATGEAKLDGFANTDLSNLSTTGESHFVKSNIAVTHTANTSVGNSTTPVYINSSGVATTCSAYGAFATKAMCTSRPTTARTAYSDTPAVVVKNYYYSSAHTWYRIWSDKFCEQGGGYITYNDTNRNVGLLVEYPDTSYVISCEHETDSSSYSGSDITVLQKTASSFRVYSAGATHVAFSWYAAGYLASNYNYIYNT